MKKKFATNLILLLGLNVLVKPFWMFGIDRTVQNTVGSAEYGLFFALFNFSLLLNILLDFGLTNYNNREISRHSQLLPRYFSNMFVIKLLMSVGYFIICGVLALLLGYTGRELSILAFLVFNQFLSSFILYLRSNISGLQMFKTDSLLSVTDRILMIAICSVLLWGLPSSNFQIEWFVYAQTVSYSLTAIIAFALVYAKAAFFMPRLDRAFLISIVRQSYPYALLILLMSSYTRVDTVMLERMLPAGNVQAGIYAQAFRLLDAANMLPFLFAGLLLPMFSRMIKREEPIYPLLGFAFRLLMVTSFSLALAGIVFREPIMDTLYVDHFDESSAVLAVLMLSFVFISVIYIFGTLLTANGSLRYLNYISGFGVAINIVLNFILIPRYYVMGAAVSSLITQLLMATLQALLCLRIFRVPVRVRHLTPFVLFIGGCLLLVVLAQSLFSSWFLSLCSFLAASVVLVFITGLIRIKDLLMLFSGGEEEGSS